MTSTIFDKPVRPAASQIPRHAGNGNPKIFPEDQYGEKNPKGSYYTRTTTFLSALSDKETLMQWKLRIQLEGLHRSPSILADYAFIEDPVADKAKVQKLSDKALDAGDVSIKADLGTMIHEASEALDRGEDWRKLVPPEHEADLLAYHRAMQEWGAKVVSIEEFCVNDEFKIAGTFDRALLLPSGDAVCGDIKTGGVAYDRGKFPMQLAAYARMQRYNPTTYKRSPLSFGLVDMSTDVGYVIHVPQGEGRCDIIEVDLNKGYEGLVLCQQVRDWRSYWNRKASWNEPIVSVSA